MLAIITSFCLLASPLQFLLLPLIIPLPASNAFWIPHDAAMLAVTQLSIPGLFMLLQTLPHQANAFWQGLLFPVAAESVVKTRQCGCYGLPVAKEPGSAVVSSLKVGLIYCFLIFRTPKSPHTVLVCGNISTVQLKI